MKKIKFLNRISTRLFMIVGLFSFVPMIFLYFYAVDEASTTLNNSIRENLIEKSSLVGSNVDQIILQRINEARILSQADVLESDDTKKIIQYLSEIVEESSGLISIDLIDINGNYIASSGKQNEIEKNLIERHPSLTQIFQNALISSQGDVFVNEVMILDDGPSVVYLTPITDDANTTVIKILLMKVSLKEITRIVLDFNERLRGNDHVYLVDNLGRVIVTSDPDIELMGFFPDLSVQPQLLNNFSIQGQIASLIYDSADGHSVMAVYSDMGEFGLNQSLHWHIIAVAQLDALFKPVSVLKSTLISITLIVGVLSLILAYWMGNYLTKSLSRLSIAANKIQSGETDTRMGFHAENEIGHLALTIDNTLDSLGAALSEAKQANQAKSDFLTSMSHDLRTPLNAIIGFSEFMKDDLDGSVHNKKYFEYANIINGSGHYLLTLVNNVLDFSQLASGGNSLFKEDIDLYDLAVECQSHLHFLVQEKHIKHTIKIDKNLKPLNADRQAMMQIIMNLTGNAIKFTPEGGSITVSADILNGGHVIRVIDTGIGIPEEELGHITDPFTRASANPHHSNVEGTGLGLAIVKSLTSKHGGTLDIQSKVGSGTTVIVTIPSKPREA